ncbi:MAG: DNA polymerase I [Candidatus Omnitrophota bacterium]|jgi:DNA polymerase-1|nr:MAG: DNA polymerase I [Candidatus Omnitrophota bacterium]
MDKTFLIDGSSVFFRAYHGIRNLRRSDGMATNAVYGYVMTLRSLLNEYKPSEMVVAFDLPDKTFRVDLYAPYKANRAALPDDLAVQIPYIKKITDCLGIPRFEMPGYEADDLLGTLAVWLAKHGKQVMIVSGDKDLMQLVDDSISVLRLAQQKNMIFSENEVKERYGVNPDQLIDVLALMGDSSDNVPGVPGIGEKNAIALIQEYGALENLYENIDAVTGKKRKENLVTYKEQAFLSRTLVTIKTDAPLEITDGFYKISKFDVNRLRQQYEELEFRSFAQELEKAPASDREKQYETIDTLDKLAKVVPAIREKSQCAFDTETTSLDSLSARLVGLSFSIDRNQGWYIPVGHHSGGNVSLEQATPLLKEILESETIGKTGHNVKYDLHVLENANIYLRGVQDDTLLASYLVQPEMESHKLDDLAWRCFAMEMTPIADLIGKGRNQKSMADVDVETVSDYACEDTDATWRLRSVLMPKIDEYDLGILYREVELPLLRVLADMERRGIKVDPAVLIEQSRELERELETLAGEIYRSVGKEFNINSPLQLAQILYDDLKLLSGRTRSTRADILEKLAADGAPIAQQILDYRHRQKIKSTYLDALQKLIRSETGRVHTTYNQAVANTGRLSSSDPNLQNIPIRTDLGRRVRRAFVAEEGSLLVSLDYSQIELRILAHISQDPGLLQAFSAGEDIHRRTAAEIFDVKPDEVNADMRRKAKEINFGLNYGMSPYGLARRLLIDDKEAASYIERYFARYPRVRTYMDETTDFAMNHLYVTTIMNRRIPTLGIRDSNRMRQENAKRAAINAPIQGSAADLLKKAMICVDELIRPLRREAAILLTVHDELVLEIKEERAEEICRQCRERMEHAMDLSVPTPVEFSLGRSWADLK